MMDFLRKKKNYVSTCDNVVYNITLYFLTA